MKFRNVKYNRGMYVSVVFIESELHYTESSALIVRRYTGVITRLDNEYITISEFSGNTDTLTMIPWEKVIYIADKHVRTSNKFTNWMRKKTANIRNTRMLKSSLKELKARIKY